MGPHLCEGILFAPIPLPSDRCELNTYNGIYTKVPNSALTCTYEDTLVNWQDVTGASLYLNFPDIRQDLALTMGNICAIIVFKQKGFYLWTKRQSES